MSKRSYGCGGAGCISDTTERFEGDVRNSNQPVFQEYKKISPRGLERHLNEFVVLFPYSEKYPYIGKAGYVGVNDDNEPCIYWGIKEVAIMHGDLISFGSKIHPKSPNNYTFIDD